MPPSISEEEKGGQQQEHHQRHTGRRYREERYRGTRGKQRGEQLRDLFQQPPCPRHMAQGKKRKVPSGQDKKRCRKTHDERAEIHLPYGRDRHRKRRQDHQRSARLHGQKRVHAMGAGRGKQQGGAGQIAQREPQAGELIRSEKQLQDQRGRKGNRSPARPSPKKQEQHVEEQRPHKGRFRPHQQYEETGKQYSIYTTD